jgi:CRP-like cAMP-binding protein
MFLLGHGTVNVHIGEQFITSLGAGACFGEMALIGDPRRTSDVTAASYCDIFKLSKKQFDELISTHPDLKANVVRIAAERKSKLNEDTGISRPFDKVG